MVWNKLKGKKGFENEKREKIEVRYRNCTITKLFILWKNQCVEKHIDYCAFTQFKNILNKHVKWLKKPIKKTDMCAICVDGQKCVKNFKTEKNEEKYPF